MEILLESTSNSSVSQKQTLELKKAKAEVEAADLKAQPSSFNMEQLNELMVKSLKSELAKLLSTYDFSSSFPTKLKELPSKFLELSGEVNELKKLVNELKVELLTKLKEIPLKLEDFTKIVTSLTSQVADLKTLQWELPKEFLSVPTNVANVQAKLKILDSLLSLLGKVTDALNRFAQVFKNASQRAGETSVPSAGEADTMTSSSQIEREHIKKDKGKKIMFLNDAEDESTECGSDDDDESRNMSGFMAESSKQKKLKKFDFYTESGEHFHLTEEEINAQKKISKDAKAKAAKLEGERRRE
nr:hypothetical protein [Tanacetum cinerariifolium]